jgi:hypothetical protein
MSGLEPALTRDERSEEFQLYSGYRLTWIPRALQEVLDTALAVNAPFVRPEHHMTGDRRKTADDRRRLDGYDFAHAIVDDHSRLAYVELLDNELAQTVTGLVARGLAYFHDRGITASRLMTDNAFNYTKNRSLRELLVDRAIDHRTTRPYRPRTNGKVERFHQKDGARVGIRPDVPLKQRTQARAATLARPLQRATPPQRPRQPTTDQRSPRRRRHLPLDTDLRHRSAARAGVGGATPPADSRARPDRPPGPRLRPAARWPCGELTCLPRTPARAIPTG